MDVLVTTCCKDKRREEALLPARKRYLSDRIEYVCREGERLEIPVLIFSGLYGLLTLVQPIPWYDYLLNFDEVGGMAERLAVQMEEHGVTGLRFYGWPADVPGWAPYHQALERGCHIGKVSYRFVLCNMPDHSPAR